MKRFILLGLVFLSFTIKGKAQNLVPNPSFEIYNSCTNIAITSADGWCSVSSIIGSCAHLHPCHSDTYTQAPLQYLDNCFKSYQPVRTGIAYAEFGMSISPSQQEGSRPMVKLIDTLGAGKIYCVTYYISMWNNARYSFDKLGALLTPTPFPCSTPGGTVFPSIAGQYTPQIVSAPGDALEDTTGWMEISGTFTAIGNEAYLTLGDFFLHNQHLIKDSYPNCNGLAEYYIDDVSVEVVEIAKAKNDTLMMQGDSIMVGNNKSEAALFSWQPSTGLSCTSCPNPKASPSITTTYTVTKTQCKAVTSDEITITVSPTGVNELSYANSIKISPNPAQEYLSIDIPAPLPVMEKIKIKITDVLGRDILITDCQNQLDISTLEKGIYFVSVLHGNKSLITKKIVKE